MLDKQYNLYSVDTGHFYSNRERYLHDMNCKYRRERNYVQNKLPEIEKALQQLGYTDVDIKNLRMAKQTKKILLIIHMILFPNICVGWN